MAFDQSVITSVAPPIVDDAELLISWTTSAPPGTPFQIYINRRLAWHGTQTKAIVPYPGEFSRYEIGAVASGEDDKDFSASLPAVPGGGDRVTLSWEGGTYLASDIVKFNIYSGTAPGGAVSFAAPIDTVTAYVQGVKTDGFGQGGFGMGGFGSAGASYSWTSGRLAPGTWNFAVKGQDAAGNEGPAATTSATIAGPPNPPAVGTDGKRLRYTYNSGTRVATLAWLASPTG